MLVRFGQVGGVPPVFLLRTEQLCYRTAVSVTDIYATTTTLATVFLFVNRLLFWAYSTQFSTVYRGVAVLYLMGSINE